MARVGRRVPPRAPRRFTEPGRRRPVQPPMPADALLPSFVPRAEPGFLGTLEDYERAAREASPMVRHVRVRALENDPRMKPGHVVVKVRRSWWRLLPEGELLRVHHFIAGRNPLGVTLEVT